MLLCSKLSHLCWGLSAAHSVQLGGQMLHLRLLMHNEVSRRDPALLVWPNPAIRPVPPATCDCLSPPVPEPPPTGTPEPGVVPTLPI